MKRVVTYGLVFASESYKGWLKSTKQMHCKYIYVSGCRSMETAVKLQDVLV